MVVLIEAIRAVATRGFILSIIITLCATYLVSHGVDKEMMELWFKGIGFIFTGYMGFKTYKQMRGTPNADRGGRTTKVVQESDASI